MHVHLLAIRLSEIWHGLVVHPLKLDTEGLGFS